MKKKKKYYKIRNLTPREVGRFMGVKDDDIDTMMKCGFSDPQLCKMYGNSIVVDCMSHIFRKLFIDKSVKKRDELW